MGRSLRTHRPSRSWRMRLGRGEGGEAAAKVWSDGFGGGRKNGMHMENGTLRKGCVHDGANGFRKVRSEKHFN